MLKIYSDAATKGNPGPSGAGLLLVGDKERVQLGIPLPEMNNHQAEFTACRLALETALNRFSTDQTVLLFTDSRVLADTIEKDFTNNPDYQDEFAQIQKLLQKFNLVICRWIPEKENRGADTLARQGLRKGIKLNSRERG